MKPNWSVVQWMVGSLVLLLLLSACEVPAPRPEDVQISTVAPENVPTLQPTATPEAVMTVVVTAEGTPVDAAGTPGAEVTAEATAVPFDGTYTVQAGDTLSRLAVVYGVTVEEIMLANGLTDSDTLEIGQVLTIPEPGSTIVAPTAAAGTATAAPSTTERVHIVQAGENLFRIGLQYGFTVQELADYNGIANPNTLEIGQEIRIPPSN